MKIVLTRKLAEEMDGVNVSRHTVGDLLDLPPEKATLLIREGWAIADRRHMHATPRFERRGGGGTQAARNGPDDALSRVS